MNKAAGPVVLAAGGTGGHMFPAEAVAAELGRRGRAAVLVTDARGAGFGAGVPVHRISARSPGGGVGGAARGAASLCRGWFQARRLLGRIGPAAAIGFGGYPSVPTIFAAARAGVPSVIHEQNAVLGRANALLARFADAIATGFPAAEGVRARDLPKTVHTGVPARPRALALGGAPYVRPHTDTLVVVGGSQGARVLSDVVPAAIGLLPEGLRARLALVQQTRPEDRARVEDACRALAVTAEVRPFFDDLPERMAAASLVVARAGASTIAELLTIGRPAILVPYPHAADDHQRANADAVAGAGAAWTMAEAGFTPEALAARLEALLASDGALAAAAERALALAAPEAASRIADRIERVERLGDRRRAA